MIRLDDLALFVRSASLGSFSGAAREADLLPGQVSAAIKRLEDELGVRLFARSTRSLRLTAEGDIYLPHARDVLQSEREGRERLRGDDAELRGLLQLAAPSDLGRNVLLPWLSEFRAAHPALQLRLLLSDQVADVFREPVDVAIRYGAMADASCVALPLAPANARVLVAAPGYLSRRGRPASLDALADHDCLTYVLGGKVYDQWSFVQANPQGDRRKVVSVGGPMVCDDADIVRRWAVDGYGLAYKSWLDVCADVRAGRLEVLLPGVACEPVPLQLVCPHRKQFSPAIRQLQAMLAERLSELGNPPGIEAHLSVLRIPAAT